MSLEVGGLGPVFAAFDVLEKHVLQRWEVWLGCQELVLDVTTGEETVS